MSASTERSGASARGLALEAVPLTELLSPDELVSGQPANQSFQLQHAERRHDLSRGQSREDNQLVKAGGIAFALD